MKDQKSPLRRDGFSFFVLKISIPSHSHPGVGRISILSNHGSLIFNLGDEFLKNILRHAHLHVFTEHVNGGTKMNKLYWLIIYHISNTVSKNVIAYSSIFKININNILHTCIVLLHYILLISYFDIFRNEI